MEYIFLALIVLQYLNIYSSCELNTSRSKGENENCNPHYF